MFLLNNCVSHYSTNPFHSPAKPNLQNFIIVTTSPSRRTLVSLTVSSNLIALFNALQAPLRSNYTLSLFLPSSPTIQLPPSQPPSLPDPANPLNTNNLAAAQSAIVGLPIKKHKTSHKANDIKEHVPNSTPLPAPPLSLITCSKSSKPLLDFPLQYQ